MELLVTCQKFIQVNAYSVNRIYENKIAESLPIGF